MAIAILWTSSQVYSDLPARCVLCLGCYTTAHHLQKVGTRKKVDPSDHLHTLKTKVDPEPTPAAHRIIRSSETILILRPLLPDLYLLLAKIL